MMFCTSSIRSVNNMPLFNVKGNDFETKVQPIFNLTRTGYAYGPIIEFNGEYSLISDGKSIFKYDGNSFFNLTDKIKQVIVYGNNPLGEIVAISWTGNKWLIGGSRGILEFNGTGFKLISPWFMGTVMDIKWNGEYWLIATRGGLLIYNGTHVGQVGWAYILNIPRNENAEAWALEWNGDYWLVGGDHIYRGGPLLLKIEEFTNVGPDYYVSKYEELSNKVIDPHLISEIIWNGIYWLFNNRGNLCKYDVESFVNLMYKLQKQLKLEQNFVSISGVKWYKGMWYITMCYQKNMFYQEGADFYGKVIAFDGDNFMDLSNKINDFEDWSEIGIPITLENCNEYWLIALTNIQEVNVDQSSTYIFKISSNEMEITEIPEPETEAEPETEHEVKPESEQESHGIPGFPLTSSLFGILLGTLLILVTNRRPFPHA
jgi:hypothetical protein